MDLLFKNPKYFFEVYFDILWWEFLLAFASISLISFAIDYLLHKRIDRHRIIMVILFSLYMTVVFSATLLGKNRRGISGVRLNIFKDIVNIFLLNDVHAVREFCSNVLLFLPFVPLISGAFSVSSCKIGVIIGTAVSVLIEILQYALSVGFAQFNDVLANIIGMLAGLFFMKIVQTIAKKWWIE